MTSVAVESRRWSRRCWLGLIVLVLGIQVGLIFWLGERSPIRRRPAASGLTVRLAGSASAELLTLRDPTLFVLPRPQGLASPAWLKTPQPAVRAFVWPEPTNYPVPAMAQPGAAFNRFVETNSFLPVLPPVKPEPQRSLPDLQPQRVSAGQSAVRLEDALAQRRLITPLDLHSWTNHDILANSVVQLVVDADGVPRSVTLLSGCGSQPADQQALERAWAARFEPLGRNPAVAAPDPTAQLSWGRMIFLWHTVPPPPTNAPTSSS